MKLYTEEQVKSLVHQCRIYNVPAERFLFNYTPIELPTDEEIEEEIRLNEYVDNDCDFRQGAEFVINKIQGGNK